MNKNAFGFIILLIGILFAAGIWYFFASSNTAQRVLPTYFTYSVEELTSLKGLSSKQNITAEDLYRLDDVAFDLIAKNTPRKDFTAETSKIYAYLAVATRDFAFISHNTRGEFEGSVDPLSKEILCLYFVDDCAAISTYGENDAYSHAITELVMTKVLERIASDTAGLTPYPVKIGKEYWDGPQPSTGIANGSSKGWFITSGDQFRAPPPPAYDSEEFVNQVKLTQDALANATQQQKQATVFWAGGPGTKTPPGQLLILGDDYMQSKNVPVEKVLLVRSVLAMAVADAVTAVFDSKYTYLVKRPFMMDSSLITIMPTPNHPSYPAGHSTLSAAGITVLMHYFPEDTEMWKEKGYEAGMSRIWGGIHYIMDHNAGVTIGEQVGKAAIAGTLWKEE